LENVNKLNQKAGMTFVTSISCCWHIIAVVVFFSESFGSTAVNVNKAVMTERRELLFHSPCGNHPNSLSGVWQNLALH